MKRPDTVALSARFADLAYRDCEKGVGAAAVEGDDEFSVKFSRLRLPCALKLF